MYERSWIIVQYSFIIEIRLCIAVVQRSQLLTENVECVRFDVEPFQNDTITCKNISLAVHTHISIESTTFSMQIYMC